jgi:hypothetical protein
MASPLKDQKNRKIRTFPKEQLMKILHRSHIMRVLRKNVDVMFCNHYGVSAECVLLSLP